MDNQRLEEFYGVTKAQILQAISEHLKSQVEYVKDYAPIKEDVVAQLSSLKEEDVEIEEVNGKYAPCDFVIHGEADGRKSDYVSQRYLTIRKRFMLLFCESDNSLVIDRFKDSLKKACKITDDNIYNVSKSMEAIEENSSVIGKVAKQYATHEFETIGYEYLRHRIFKIDIGDPIGGFSNIYACIITTAITNKKGEKEKIPCAYVVLDANEAYEIYPCVHCSVIEGKENAIQKIIRKIKRIFKK